MAQTATLLTTLFLVSLCLVPAAQAAQWTDVATISSTLGNNAGYLCTGAGKTGLGCPTYAPYVSASTGYVGIGTTDPSVSLHVAGTINGFQLQSGGSNINGSLNIRRASGGIASYLGSLAGASYINQYGGQLGLGTPNPSTTLAVVGSVRLGAETSTTLAACDANRLGAMKYEGSSFYVCQSTTNGWEPIATGGISSTVDRISSNSQAGVTANSTGYISLTTGGVTGTLYFTPGAVMVGGGVSTTGGISGSTGYFNTFQVGDTAAFTNAISPFQSYGNIVGNYTGIGGVEMRNTNAGANADFRFVLSDERGASGNYMAFSMPSSNNSNLLFSNPRNQMAALFVSNGTTAPATGRALALGTVSANPIIFGTSNTEQMRITSSGLVGIGTNSPSATLQVVGSAIINNLPIRNQNTSDASSSIGTNSSGHLFLNAGSTNNIFFSVGGYNSASTKMIIASTGRIGMGVSNLTPATLLDVSGTVRMADGGENCDVSRTGAIKYSGNNFYVCQSTTNGWEPIATGGVSSTVDRITSNSQAAVFANSTGYISLTTGGVTGTVYFTPGGKLVNSGVSTTGPISGTDGYFSGNVGIGITSPSAPFHVSSSGGTGAPSSVSSRTVAIFEGGNSGGTVISLMSKATGGAYSGFFFGTPGANQAAGQLAYIPQSSAFRFLTVGGNAGTNSMFLSSVGTYLGPDAMTPSTTLTVGGSIRVGTEVSATFATCDANRLGAMKYSSGSFYICQNTTNGWEPLATTTSSSTPSINTGASGSIVYRNEYGYLYATNTLSISSTTGNVGIGFGAPAWMPSNSLYVNGQIATPGTITGGNFAFNGGATSIQGSGVSATSYLAFLTSGTEALRIVSTGLVGIGTTAPVASLDISSTSGLRIQSGPPAAAYVLTATGSTINSVYNGGYSRFRLDSDATLGVGGAGRLSLADSSGGSISTVTGYNGNLVLNGSGGLVGIGTTSPSTSLQVSGTLKIANGGEACDTSRLGAMRYTASKFYVCQSTLNGWEPLSTTTSSSIPSINTGASGSIVYRNEFGYLYASDSLSISSTTGSVGIGAGAPAAMGNNGLYSAGTIWANNNFSAITGDYYASNAHGLLWGTGNNSVTGSAAAQYIALTTSGTEALRVVSTGLVGIGTSAPSATLHVSGTIRANTVLGTSSIRVTDPTAAFNRVELNTISDSGILRMYNTAGNNNVFLTTSGTSFIRNSNLTLGTSTPATSILHIIGTSDTTGGITIGATDGSTRLRMYPLADYSGAIQTANINGQLFFLNSAGNTRAIFNLNAGNFFFGGSNASPTTAVQISGTIRVADGGEACDVSRTGAIKYAGTAFYVCQNTSNGWEPLATTTSSTTPSIGTGASGSLVYRNEFGYLYATNTLSISSTTGSVGIGAGAPVALGNNGLYAAGNLQTDGTMQSIGSYTFNSTGARYIIWNNANGASILGDPASKYLAFQTSGTEALRITSSSNVGINTTDPSATLDVYGRLIVGKAGTNGNIGFRRNDGNNNASVGYTPGNSTDFAFTNSSGGSNFQWWLNTGTSVTEVMRLSPSGKLGIGTSNPSTTLHLLGSLRLAAETSTTFATCDTNRLGAIKYESNMFQICQTAANGWEPLSTTTSTSTVSINTGASGSLVYRNEFGVLYATSTLSISSTTGSVGIGAGAPTTLGNNGLYTSGQIFSDGPAIITGYSNTNTSSFGFGNSTVRILGDARAANQYMAFQTSGTTAMTIVSTGLVGIGTTAAPSATLQVSGTIRIANGGESCDTNRLGALKYASGAFYICQSVSNGWEPLATSGATANTDRITSNSQAGITANATGYISLTTGGVTGTAYFTPASVLINGGVSTTGPVSTTSLYVSNDAVIDNGSNLILKPPSTGGTLPVTIQNGGSARMVFKINGTTSFEARGTGILPITGAMLDIYSQPLITFFTSTVSATNALRVVNAATGVNPNLGVSGTDADIGLTLATKGAGSVYISSSRVGIGSNILTPSTTLHLAGAIRLAADSSTTLNTCDTNRLGAIKYESNMFQICQTAANGWEPLATTTSSTNVSINTGASGSLVYRNEFGVLYASSSLSISSTTGSVGIGAGAPASLGNNGLYSSGNIQASGFLGGEFYPQAGYGLQWNASNRIYGTSVSTSQYIAFMTSGTEAMRIVSTGNVGINTTAPTTDLYIGNAAASTAAITLHRYAGNEPSIVFRSGSNVGASATQLRGIPDGGLRITNGTATTESVRITSSGLVGIGTDVPDAPLTISSSVSNQINIVNGAYKLSIGAAGNGDTYLGRNGGNLYLGNYSTSQYFRVSGGGSFNISSTANSIITGAGLLGIGNISWTGTPPSTTVDIKGSIRLAAETSTTLATCDTNRLGAIKYESNMFQICQTAANGWEPLATGGVSSTQDRIISGTTQAIAYNNTSLSLVTAGTERIVIGTTGLVGIAMQPQANVQLSVSGTMSVLNGRIGLLSSTSTSVFVGSFAGSANGGANNSAFGYYAAQNNGGSSVSAFGHYAAQNNTGNNLAALGLNAGMYNVGDAVVAIGQSAAQYNSSTNVTAVGFNAGQYNSGTAVTALGYYAGRNNNAVYLTAVGYQTAQTNTGFGLSAMGYQAGQNNTGGTGVAMGYQAAQNNTGDSLTALGYQAAQNNSNTNVTAIGYGSAQNNTAANLSALGFKAAQANTGSNTTAIGFSAAISNTGNNLAALGMNAAQYNTGADVVALGFQSAQYNAGNTAIAIGSSALQYAIGTGNVGIGKNALQSVSNTGNINWNTALGTFAGQGLTTGSNSNTLIGYSAGQGITTGTGNVLLGAGTAPFSNTGSYQLDIANAIWGNIGSGTGNANRIGINVTSPSTALEVSGTISATNILINGQSLASALNTDRITSSTSGVYVSATGVVSIITSGSTAGYFNGLGLIAGGVSATTISTTILQLAPVSGSAGISTSLAGDNLGNHTATTTLNMNTNDITGVTSISASSTIKTTAALQSGNTDTTCSTSADYGKMRFDATAGQLYVCRP